MVLTVAPKHNWKENMTRRAFGIEYLLLVVAIILAGCGRGDLVGPGNEDRIVVSNDEEELNKRITYFVDEQSPNQPKSQVGKFSYQSLSSQEPQLKLRAEVAAPVVNGHTLHASHLTFDQRRTYVAFHTVNSAYRGAIEIYDVQNIAQPRILSQALFKDTDITIAAKQDGKLFVAEATDSEHSSQFDSPACLEIIELQNGALTNKSERYDLPSFNANDVACFDSTIFVTTGTTGGTLSFFSNHSMELVHQIRMDRAKAVAKSNNYIVLLEGTGTRLHLYRRKTWQFEKTIEVGCENFFQAKSELDVVDNVAYLSGPTCGLMIVDLKSGKVTNALRPSGTGRTNAISVTEDGLVFVANGSAGLLMGKISGTDVQVIGSAQFDGSTNYVAARGNNVFVANGVGGLKILEIVR